MTVGQQHLSPTHIIPLLQSKEVWVPRAYGKEIAAAAAAAAAALLRVMTRPNDGLVAPEGTYTLVSSYVLPPQPAFMNTAVTASSLAPMSNNPNTLQAATSPQQQPAVSPGNAVPGATSLAPAMSASTSSNGGVAGPSSASAIAQMSYAGINGTSPSNATAASAAAASAAGAASYNGGLDGAADGTGSSSGYIGYTPGAGDPETAKTALHHISMQAQSAWSHVPALPRSCISVAGVRNLGVPTSLSSSIPVGLGRKDRQQASQMSTATQMPLEGGSGGAAVADGSNASSSDLNGGGGAEGLTGNELRGTANGAQGLGAGAAGPIAAGNGQGPQPSSSRPAHLGPILEATLAAQGIDAAASHMTGGAGGLPGMAALQLLSHLGGPGSAAAAAHGGSTAGMGMAQVTAPKNLPKPRHNIKQTSSSFVQRLQSHPEFGKLLSQRAEGSAIERHAFMSRGRILYWIGETTSGWIKDPIARLTFGVSISAHDINQNTRSATRLDVIIGFSSGDLIWLEAISMRYQRINKGGCINDAPITGVRWVPGSDVLFLTTHSDGTCTLFDVAREDSAPGSWAPISGMTLGIDDAKLDEEQEEILSNQIDGPAGSDDWIAATARRGQLSSAVKAWDPRTGILITRPAAMEGEAGRRSWAKQNPVAHWRVTPSVSITDMAFSPDHTKIALVATDGHLRLINLLTESLEGTFQSYYGSINKVVWSPDARFLLTAGCDDLVSIWTSDGRLLSRCPGHTSFVTGLAFDPWRWRKEDRTYRFVSVGEDGKVFLWDFSSAALHRPRPVGTAHSSARRSHHPNFSSGNSNTGHSAGSGLAATAGSTFSSSYDQYGRRQSAGARRTSMAAEDAAASAAAANGLSGQPAYRRAQYRGEVAELQPVASFQVGPVNVSRILETASGGNVVPLNPLDNGLSSSSASSGLGANAASASGGGSVASPSSPQSAASIAAVALGHAQGMAAAWANGAQGMAAAANLPAGAYTPAIPVNTGSSGSTSTTTGASSNTAFNDPGSPNDLLVEVRCRQDGILLMHKSGALRFLRRPAQSSPHHQVDLGKAQ